MVRIIVMLAVLVAATVGATAEVFVSDVVDIKIGDVDAVHDVPNIANVVDIKILDSGLKVIDGKNPSDVKVNFPPNITNAQDYPEDLYLPDEDPIDNTIDDTLGSDDIIDVINNFISERDPMLQLFLHICFLHPTCYQMDSPSTINYTTSISVISPISKDMADNLSARRTETARNILVNLIREVQEKIKVLMFKYIEKNVGERGVSIMATKNIIDSVKNIWLSLNGDLEYAKSSIQELFYLLPGKTEVLLQEAAQEGYQQYVRSSSWDSWKKKRA